MKTYPLEEALKAQKALRDAANLGEEEFPIQAFVGMISDEVEALRRMGKSDDQIAQLIEAHSQIRISGGEIAENYASPEERPHEDSTTRCSLEYRSAELRGTALLQIIFRFLVGGVVVSLFAALADTLKPKSFAGLFGAAPSVALATLGLTIATEGRLYASVEARSMIAGAAAFFIYATVCTKVLMTFPWSVLKVTSAALIAWFVAAGVFFFAWLR